MRHQEIKILRWHILFIKRILFKALRDGTRERWSSRHSLILGIKVVSNNVVRLAIDNQGGEIDLSFGRSSQDSGGNCQDKERQENPLYLEIEHPQNLPTYVFEKFVKTWPEWSKLLSSIGRDRLELCPWQLSSINLD